MIFIVRGADAPADVRVVKARRARGGAVGHDYFCVSDDAESSLDVFRARGLEVQPLHDGWYPDDAEGGVAVWGNGRFWEVRSTPFTVVAAG